MTEELTTLSIIEASVRFREGSLKPSELTEAYLTAIAERDPELHAYLSVAGDEARAQAAEADARFAEGEPRGPLDGIPIAVKDNILIAGYRATAGSRMLESYVASYDATVVAKLRAQGAVFLGKTNMDEFAMGSSTEQSAFGPTRNPRDPSRVPGGSSGGSAAAVAANLCAAALGTDTGGSIRQPAGFCGIVGLKPTYGSVSRSGLIAMASSLDQAGPLTKTVEDAELLFSVMAGHDPCDATTHPDRHGEPPYSAEAAAADPSNLASLRIGLPREYFGEGLDGRIRAQVQRAVEVLKSAGASVQDVSLPHASYALAVYYLVMPSEVSANLARFDGIRYGSSVLRDSKSAMDDSFWNVYVQTRQKYFGAEVKRRIMLGTFALSSGYYDAYYARAQKVRALIARDFDRAFENVDLLVTPVSPTLPFRFGERTHDPLAMYLADIYTVSVNLVGIPGLVVPFGGIEEEGVLFPVGIQLIGKPFSEPLLFTVGKTLEAARAS